MAYDYRDSTHEKNVIEHGNNTGIKKKPKITCAWCVTS